MTDRVRLIALPAQEDSLSIMLRRVHGPYAQYCDARSWQNRFFACTPGARHLWSALAYGLRTTCRSSFEGLYVQIDSAVLRALLFVVLATWCSPAEAQKTVKRVVIYTAQGGLGASESQIVSIQRIGDKFLANGRPVSAVQVQSLAAALSAAPRAEPDMANLGITDEWLRVESQRPDDRIQAPERTAGQEKLFQKSFTNPNLVANVLPNIFGEFMLDYLAFCKVEVVFDDGSKVSAESYSPYVFMLPWSMKGRHLTYNADISRAVASLLPAESVNQRALAGDGLAFDLTNAVMASIEPEWNLLGSEERAGESLKMLRTAYEVVTAEITPYQLPEYGRYDYSGAPEEMNLHAAVRRSSFPANLTDALVLHYSDRKKVEGVDEFLKLAARYEDLALSVPWLNGYIRDNPRVAVRISYVHGKSFGDRAMRVFAADMKLRGREDLIEQVKSQQAGIALLVIGDTHAESYWLLFPDKHMVLWRYAGPSGLLKWNPKDLRKGRGVCSEYEYRAVVCSGREITAEGMLAPGT